MKNILILLVTIFLSHFSFGQENINTFQKQTFGLSFGVGAHFGTDFDSNIIQGENYLSRSETPKVLSFAFIYKRQLYKSIYLRTGLNYSAHYDFSPYEIKSNSNLPSAASIGNGKTMGLFYHTSKISLPIQLEWQKSINKNWTVQLYGGLHISSYLIGTSTYVGRSSVSPLDPAISSVRIYNVRMDYFDEDGNNDMMLSYTKFEGAIGIEVNRDFKFGGIALGIEYYQGTKKLSQSSYEILPDYLEHFSSGTFKLNRNYMSVNIVYTF